MKEVVALLLLLLLLCTLDRVSKENCILINIKFYFVKICFFVLGIGGWLIPIWG